MRVSGAQRRPRVVVGIRDLGFHQEVLDWIERDPRIDVVGAAADPERFVQFRGQGPPDLYVVCPQLAHELRHPAARRQLSPVLLVAQEMTVPVLREALELGAVGVFAWPEERGELADAIAGALVERVDDRAQHGRVVAVMGARGGAGTTFLSSNLAAIFAGRGIRCAVVDLDASFADITVALGVGAEEGSRTIADLVPVMHELSPEHLEDALYRHPAGFHALLAPAEPDADETVPLGLYSASIALLACSFEVVLLHVPRTIDATARLAIDLADEVLFVVTLDLFSLFGARRLMAALGLRERAAGYRVIVNRLARQEVTLGDVERVLDVSASAVVRFDPVVKRTQARGQLLSTKSRRAGKDLRALARLLVSDWGREREMGA